MTEAHGLSSLLQRLLGNSPPEPIQLSEAERARLLHAVSQLSLIERGVAALRNFFETGVSEFNRYLAELKLVGDPKLSRQAALKSQSFRRGISKALADLQSPVGQEYLTNVTALEYPDQNWRNWWLRLLDDPIGLAKAHVDKIIVGLREEDALTTASADEFEFAETDRHYHIRAFGVVGKFDKTMVGFVYLQRLIRSQGISASIAEFLDDGTLKIRADQKSRGRDPVTDQQGRQRIREATSALEQEIEQLKGRYEDAQEFHNSEESEKCRELLVRKQRELNEIRAQAEKDTGLFGKPRTLGGKRPDAPIRMALKRVYDLLRDEGFESLAEHFAQGVCFEGGAIIYAPQPSIQWRLNCNA